MTKLRLNGYLAIVLGFMMSTISCTTAKRAMYLRNLKPENITIDSVARDASRKVYPGDRISVQIVTADEEANKVMNVLQKSANESGSGLLVDPAGNVEIPILGTFNVKGQTPNVIRDNIKKRLDQYYKDATVYCNISGRVVILSSLNSLSGSSQGATGSGVASIPMLDERLTIPELLSGMRLSNLRLEKSWIIREIDGKRVVSKLNLNSADILKSPFFYLRNNDIIYIEPRKFNLFLESNMPFRNLIGLLAGFSGLALAVVLAVK